MPNEEPRNVYPEPDTGSKEVARDGGSQWLDDHLEILRKTIVKEASRRAEVNGRDEPEPRDIAQAALLFAPGERFPPLDPFSFLTKIGITGVTLVSAVLALAFGGIGISQTRAGNTQIASGAFDIAKIFAGAIVGSTGATVVAAKRS